MIIESVVYVSFLILMVILYVATRHRYRCPQCETEMPQFLGPHSVLILQRLQGYTVCQQCGTEFYMNGVSRTATPTWSSYAAIMFPAILVAYLATGLVLLCIHLPNAYGAPAEPATIPAAMNAPNLIARPDLGPIKTDPLTGRAIPPVPSGMSQKEFERLTKP